MKATSVTPLRLGILLIAVTAVVAVLIFWKDRITVALTPTSTIKVHLAENYGMSPYASRVKVAGVEVGQVTDVQPEPGGALVTVEVDTDVPGKLRTQPSGQVRPTTLLGGNYFLDLVPGGPPGPFTGDIPKERTSVPVEMDKISRTLQPDTLTSLQGDLRDLDGVLSGDGRTALQDLAADAPGALRPAGPVLQALQGTEPDSDLPNLVSGLEQTAAALTSQQGQLDSIVNGLDKTSDVLGDRSHDLSQAIANLPATLDSTTTGLSKLDTSLHKLGDTAGPARPVATELDTALQHLNPVLAKLRPLVNKTNNLLVDARPLVDELTPTAQQATAVLQDVQGPVLDRLNGPIKSTVLSPYHGTGHYEGSGTDDPFYKELAYLVTGMDRLAQVTDANGATIGYGIGLSPGTVGGLPISLEQLFGNLTGIGQKGSR
ncbi:MCE family protein [Amycolatopsis acidicola]|uniref:MCE family protein n=1 Tax=Amycolatopsis acidicola TaxID=2596893 RepID=A0A5N0VMI1_9PSEU|nr:MlaD family protein [Amycolatopsis acidicola]KAA9165982.1 MCE family protein [Amycolatopsis acidicola]